MPGARTRRSNKGSRPFFLPRYSEQQLYSYGVCRVGNCVSPLFAQTFKLLLQDFQLLVG